MDYKFQLYDFNALISRLSDGLVSSGRQVIFLIGSGLTSPTVNEPAGVLSVDAIIEEIRHVFSSNEAERAALEHDLSQTGENKYQTAFEFLRGRRGQDGVNSMIRRAIWNARLRKEDNEIHTANDEKCRKYELDTENWFLPKGIESLGELVVKHPAFFCGTILTTNFDPLVEVAIKRAGGHCYRTLLHGDGALEQTYADGCHVVHLHGHWFGSDTLHSPLQLNQERPLLEDSLKSILAGKTLVVMGYGGWDDIITKVLSDLTQSTLKSLEIVWCLYGSQNDLRPKLLESLRPAINRGRVSFYVGIDGNSYLPRLLSRWGEIIDTRSAASNTSEPLPIQNGSVEAGLDTKSVEIEGGSINNYSKVDQCDRPPNVNSWIGRKAELTDMLETNCAVIGVSGIGGQGKSSLAAKYLEISINTAQYSYWDWRDCREEGDRLTTQISCMIQRASSGGILAKDICYERIGELASLLVRTTKERPGIFVFDNVDHYIDLENHLLVGDLKEAFSVFAREPTRSKFIFTCRPSIEFESANCLPINMEGFSEAEAIELFRARNVKNVSDEQIQKITSITKGHAFWLDLIALQSARQRPGSDLELIIQNISRGKKSLPQSTLLSIWQNLPEREQRLLRLLAEAVRPETENTLTAMAERYEVRPNQFFKSLRALTALNLIVVKSRHGEQDHYELHPVVREFVRLNFSRNERAPVINILVKTYNDMIKTYRVFLGKQMPDNAIDYWSGQAELQTEAGEFSAALATLSEIGNSYRNSSRPEEYVRVARKLLASIDWNHAGLEYKNFDEVIEYTCDALVQLGRKGDTDGLLARYEATLPAKDGRYINYCDIRTYAHWFRREYDLAIAWGREGRDLKIKSNADVKADTSHNLALALRDSGEYDEAIQYFIKGSTLEDVTNPENTETARGGEFYGNIGRCLQLKGDAEGASICYRKSAKLIEETTGTHFLLNQGYLRWWVGEVLIASQDHPSHELGITCLYCAWHKWERTSPQRAKEVQQIIENQTGEFSPLTYPRIQCEHKFKKWVDGKA